MKNILLIGLGRFGRHMAQKLHDLNHQVLAIDKDERRVQDAMAYVTNAEIGDATDPTLIDALGVEEFDLCVVTMGHDLQASLEITSLLKKRGAPFPDFLSFKRRRGVKEASEQRFQAKSINQDCSDKDREARILLKSSWRI